MTAYRAGPLSGAVSTAGYHVGHAVSDRRHLRRRIRGRAMPMTECDYEGYGARSEIEQNEYLSTVTTCRHTSRRRIRASSGADQGPNGWARGDLHKLIQAERIACPSFPGSSQRPGALRGRSASPGRGRGRTEAWTPPPRRARFRLPGGSLRPLALSCRSGRPRLWPVRGR